jgi:pimeloyl-ACP methyl ester carboxylesterase
MMTSPHGDGRLGALCRVPWALAPNDPAYDAFEAKFAENRIITVPTFVIQGSADPCSDPSPPDAKEAEPSLQWVNS